jgi:hypothetical protein
VYIIIHAFMLYLFILSYYHYLFYVVLVVWLFKLLMHVPIRLVLFPHRVRFFSVLNPLSDISVSKSTSGHYPYFAPNLTKNMVEDIIKEKSDPIYPIHLRTICR